MISIIEERLQAFIFAEEGAKLVFVSSKWRMLHEVAQKKIIPFLWRARCFDRIFNQGRAYGLFECRCRQWPVHSRLRSTTAVARRQEVPDALRVPLSLRNWLSAVLPSVPVGRRASARHPPEKIGRISQCIIAALEAELATGAECTFLPFLSHKFPFPAYTIRTMRKWRIEDLKYSTTSKAGELLCINELGHAYVCPRKDNVRIDLREVVDELANATSSKSCSASPILRLTTASKNGRLESVPRKNMTIAEYHLSDKRRLMRPRRGNRQSHNFAEIQSRLECGSKPELHAA